MVASKEGHKRKKNERVKAFSHLSLQFCKEKEKHGTHMKLASLLYFFDLSNGRSFF